MTVAEEKEHEPFDSSDLVGPGDDPSLVAPRAAAHQFAMRDGKVVQSPVGRQSTATGLVNDGGFVALQEQLANVDRNDPATFQYSVLWLAGRRTCRRIRQVTAGHYFGHIGLSLPSTSEGLQDEVDLLGAARASVIEECGRFVVRGWKFASAPPGMVVLAAGRVDRH